MDVNRLRFLTKHLYLIGVWCGENQRTNTIKRHMFDKEWSLYLLTTPQRYMGGQVESPFSKALPSSFTHAYKFVIRILHVFLLSTLVNNPSCKDKVLILA